MAVNSASSSVANNIYGALGNGKAIGGLASGLDTDSLVDALTSGTKLKISKQGQQRQLLSWKMTAYRSIATQLSAFQKKYLSSSASSTSRISSNTFFNTFKATSSSDKISVKADSSSTLGEFTIDKVQQLATAETLTNKNSLSTQINSTATLADLAATGTDFTGQTLKLDVNGVQKTIKLDTLTGKNAAEMEGELQNLINKAYGTKNVYIKDADGNYTDDFNTVPNVKVTITADGYINLDSDAARVIVTANSDKLGFEADQSNRVLMNSKIGDIDLFKSALQGDVFKFEINGVEITVNKNDTLNTLKNKIESSNAGVRFSYSQFTDEFTLTSKTTGGGENIVMRDTQGNFMNTLFGVQSGYGIGTNTLRMIATPTAQEPGKMIDATKAEKIKIGSNLSSMEFSLTINGETKIIKADTSDIITPEALASGAFSQGQLIAAINKGIKNAFGDNTVYFSQNSDGLVTMNTTDSSVAYTASATTSGSYNTLGILGFTQTTGNAAIKLDYDTKIASDASHNLALDKGADGKTLYGVFDVTVNGVTKQISISNFTSAGTEANDKSLATKLNAAIEEAFGKDVARNVSFSVNGGKVALETKDSNIAVGLSNSDIGDAANKVNILDELGFDLAGEKFITNSKASADSNSVTFGELHGGADLGTALSTLTINGKSFTYSSETKLQDFINEINDELGYGFATIVNGQLSFKDSKNGEITISDDGKLLNNFFGIKKDPAATETVYETQAAAVNSSQVKAGQNAEIVVDGRVVSSASNTFTINGVDITVNKVSEKGDAPIKIGVTSDPEEVVTKLKDWIADYNALVFALNSALNETQDKDKKFPPLTDEQKAEMTQDQITTWEAEAKKGLLRNDSTLRKIASDLRESLYKKVEAAGISLFDVGITIKPYGALNEAGQLEITEDGEKQLRSMLENNPDKVRMLFTDPVDGLATRINTIIDKAAKTSSVDRGSLITLAGTEINTGDNTSTLGKQIDALDKYVTTLKARLEAEYNRYWKQFSALEVAIQKMSAQSSWLTQAGA